MRYNSIGSPAPPFFDTVKTRNFLGGEAPQGRVTVSPFWSINKTSPLYGNSLKGPYRYYTDYDAGTSTPNVDEYEVPSIKSISWNRSEGQDVASCTITLYNSWHNTNSETPEQTTQLGKKGYFWPKRGTGDSALTWGQSAGTGAYKKDGTWDPSFSWENVLVEDALLRTYEGYGGIPTSGNYVSIDQNLDDENLLITGVWIVNSVQGGSDGMMTLQCSDIGRILLDQIVFPPLIPAAVYPLEYYPPGQSAFDSTWGPKIKDKFRGDNIGRDEFGREVSTSPASRGEVWIRTLNSSADGDATVNTTHPASHSVDGNWDTYALSEAYATMDGGKPYFEFLPGGSDVVGSGIDSFGLKTWAGGYTVYVSVAEDPNPSSPSSTSVWKGTESIPGGGIAYVRKINVPLTLPDGMENYMFYDLEEMTEEELAERTPANGYGTTNNPPAANTYYAHKVRLTFENLYYSHVPNGSDDRYRAGIREFTLFRNGRKLSSYNSELDLLPWTFTMAQHPTRGYWIADRDGNVYGFGDAADYDSTGFGQISMEGDSTNRVVGMAAHPSGEGYWVVDWMGNVYAQGVADHYGDFPVPNPYVALGQQGKVQARGIAATYTGEGYWVLYSNGGVAGFGDADPNSNFVPATDVATFMEYFQKKTYRVGTYIPYQLGLKGTGIASHPKRYEYIVTDGSGQVFKSVNGGPLIWQRKQGLHNRIYNPDQANYTQSSILDPSTYTSSLFRLSPLEWATDIEYSVTGDGWWIAFGSGKIASFGDATKLAKNPYVFESIGRSFQDNIIVDDVTEFIDVLGFREILWSLARDPDGTGFWVLKASGEVVGYEADFWGQPGYDGLTGYRWHDGNFDGDWMKIVKEILMWGGFLLYDPDITDADEPSVYGLLESTGIVTDTNVPPDRFDKKTLMDVIKELTEVVGYLFRITEDGRAQYSSPNWWRAGNFDQNGEPIYVAYDDAGNMERVAADYEAPGLVLPPADTLSSGATLASGEELTCNGARLVMQTDGNLVLYVEATQYGRYHAGVPGALWQTNTDGNPGAYLTMQTDGNLVVRSSGGAALWNSGTMGNPGATLAMQSDRNVVIYLSGDAIWSTGTWYPTSIGPTPYIPIVHEDEDMLNYGVTLSTTDKRSVIYVGTDLPDPKDATKTSYVKHVPPSATERYSGVSAMRGIERPAIWVSQLFENERERKLMAELIGLHAWFASRAGSASIIGNPAITMDDQVRLVEQNTSETFIHRISGINSSLDNDTRVYTMDLTTYWLGDADDWVIATEPKEATEYVYTVISNELNSWQTRTNRGLTGGGDYDAGIFTVTGEFTRTVFEVNSIAEMIVLGDSLSYLDSTLNGLTGDRWPNLLEDSGVVTVVKNGAMSGYTSQDLVDTPIVNPESTNALVIFVGANDQNVSLTGVTVEEYSQNLIYLLNNYPADQQLVVFPWPWTGYPEAEPDPAPTEEEYLAFRDAAAAAAAQASAGFLDMGTVVSSIAAANGDSDWGDYIVDWIHASALGHQLLAESISSKLYVDYGEESNWQFSGNINTIGVISDIVMTVDVLSSLGANIFMEIYDGSSLIRNIQLINHGQTISIGTLGEEGEEKTYTYVINGTPLSRGNGRLKLSFAATSATRPFVEDTLLLLDGDSPLPDQGDDVVVIPTDPTTPPPVNESSSGVLFGYCANSNSHLQSLISSGMGTPAIWRHFLTDNINSTTAWDSGIPLHISFKPDISQPVSTWSADLETLLRREGNSSGQVTYVSIWHEPENDTGKPTMGSAANFRRALNETTRICRKLTAENAGGTFYSAPCLMDYTLSPGSGRDVEEWIGLDLVDYDIITWDPYPNDHSVIPAIDVDLPMSSTTHADNIIECMDYSVSVGKPWAIAEVGTRRYDAEMSSAGVTSYTSTQRAQYMVDLADFITTLSTKPVYVCYFTYGDNSVLENPELATMNSIMTSYNA